jgi:hypothetical protein
LIGYVEKIDPNKELAGTIEMGVVVDQSGNYQPA